MTTDQINNRVNEIETSLEESRKERKQIDNLLEQQGPEPILFTDNRGHRHESFDKMVKANQAYKDQERAEKEHAAAQKMVEALEQVFTTCGLNYQRAVARGARRQRSKK